MSLTEQIKKKLEAALEPSFLEIINESDKHIGHAGYSESGESHFKIKVVSDRFAGCSRVQRQKMIYNILCIEIKDLIHALSIEAHAPGEIIPKL